MPEVSFDTSHDASGAAGIAAPAASARSRCFQTWCRPR